MKSSDIEKLKNIADGGASRQLAEELIYRFNDLASSLGCESRLLKHGVLYQRGAGNAVFAVYFSRTSSPGTVEVAFADKNIARLYEKTPASVMEWLSYLTAHIGRATKSPTSQGYPRISLNTIQSGNLLAQTIHSFFKGNPYQLPETLRPVSNDRQTIDEKVLATIWARRGQPDFRARLLHAYGSRCAITGCDVVDALEAAHITPYAEEQGYELTNGILLRGDIHTLFDLFFISIDPNSWTVRIAPSLTGSYGELDGKFLALPMEGVLQPDRNRCARHFAEWHSRWCDALC